LTFLGPAAGDECSARTGLFMDHGGAAGVVRAHGEEDEEVRVARRSVLVARGRTGMGKTIFVGPSIYAGQTR
jgi:hypothetical protein